MTEPIKRKRSKNAGLTIMALGMATSLTACGEEPLEQPKVFSSLSQCIKDTSYTEEACKQAAASSKEAHEDKAPRFATLDDCRREFGDMCKSNTTQSSSGSGFFMPMMTGFMLSEMMNSGSRHVYHHYEPVYRGSRGGYMTADGIGLKRDRYGYYNAPSPSRASYNKPASRVTSFNEWQANKTAAQKKFTTQMKRTKAVSKSGFGSKSRSSRSSRGSRGWGG